MRDYKKILAAPSAASQPPRRRTYHINVKILGDF